MRKEMKKILFYLSFLACANSFAQSTIPGVTTFGTLPAGNQPLSLLDSSFLAVQNYILKPPSINILNAGSINSQVIGLDVEQQVNPTIPLSWYSFGAAGETFTPTANTQTISGELYGMYFSANTFGSGNVTGGIYGGSFEGFNPGSGTSLLTVGVSGTANCGGVAAGNPVQTPANTGNCTNLRAGDFLVTNTSSGVATNAEGAYIEAAHNTGGGSITNNYGLFVSAQTAGTNNYAIFTQAGLNSFGDHVGIVSPPITSSLLNIGGGASTLTQTSQYGVVSNPTGSTAGTTNLIGFYSAPSTSAASYTLANLSSFYAGVPTLGSGSSVINAYGIIVNDPTIGTNNFGINVNVASGSNKWSIYASGTANNALLGNTMIGSNTAPTDALDVTGNVVVSGTLRANTGGVANKAVCWKSGTILGYCSTVVASDGSCTCN